MTFTRAQWCAAVVCAVASTLAASPAAADVLPPSAKIAGIDQTTLSQQWANWLVSFPFSAGPTTDPTGARSSLGDRGSYFFLAGSASTEPVVRQVTVRNDQVLFFPLTGAADAYTDEQIARLGLTDEAIRTELIHFMGNASGLFLQLNGADMALPAGTPNLLAYRQPTGRFDLMVASDDNLFGGAPANPAGVYRAFSDGYFVGLSPFENGSYQLHFGGRLDATGPFAGLSFTQDITYNITVVPEPATLLSLLVGLGIIAGVAARRPRERLPPA